MSTMIYPPEDPTLTDIVIDGFRIVSANDIDIAREAIAFSIVTGSTGATHQDIRDEQVVWFATVTRQN